MTLNVIPGYDIILCIFRLIHKSLIVLINLSLSGLTGQSVIVSEIQIPAFAGMTVDIAGMTVFVSPFLVFKRRASNEFADDAARWYSTWRNCCKVFEELEQSSCFGVFLLHWSNLTEKWSCVYS